MLCFMLFQAQKAAECSLVCIVTCSLIVQYKDINKLVILHSVKDLVCVINRVIIIITRKT